MKKDQHRLTTVRSYFCVNRSRRCKNFLWPLDLKIHWYIFQGFKFPFITYGFFILTFCFNIDFFTVLNTQWVMCILLFVPYRFGVTIPWIEKSKTEGVLTVTEPKNTVQSCRLELLQFCWWRFPENISFSSSQFR